MSGAIGNEKHQPVYSRPKYKIGDVVVLQEFHGSDPYIQGRIVSAQVYSNSAEWEYKISIYDPYQTSHQRIKEYCPESQIYKKL